MTAIKKNEHMFLMCSFSSSLCCGYAGHQTCGVLKDHAILGKFLPGQLIVWHINFDFGPKYSSKWKPPLIWMGARRLKTSQCILGAQLQGALFTLWPTDRMTSCRNHSTGRNGSTHKLCSDTLSMNFHSTYPQLGSIYFFLLFLWTFQTE